MEQMCIKKNPVYVVYKMGKLIDLSVSGLDPFNLDYCFEAEFASMANMSTPNEMFNFVEKHFSGFTLHDLTNLNEVAAMAATRDVSMFCSALAKFGVTMGEIPILETILVQLSSKTREVPADTVFSYGPRNPKGGRRRMFTSTPEEELFIQSFVDGMEGLIIVLACLEVLQNMDICDPFYSQYAIEASDGMKKMVNSMVKVRKIITPEIFTYTLRPFFEPKSICGKTYFAPGGAQMPVTMIDLLLWGVGETDKFCLSYWNENFKYLPASYRSKIEIITRGSSIVPSVVHRISKGVKPVMVSNAVASVEALLELFDQIMFFRAPHLGVAKANMKIRQQGALGSGGYDSYILQYLITRTKNSKKLLVSAKASLG